MNPKPDKLRRLLAGLLMGAGALLALAALFHETAILNAVATAADRIGSKWTLLGLALLGFGGYLAKPEAERQAVRNDLASVAHAWARYILPECYHCGGLMLRAQAWVTTHACECSSEPWDKIEAPAHAACAGYLVRRPDPHRSRAVEVPDRDATTREGLVEAHQTAKARLDDLAQQLARAQLEGRHDDATRAEAALAQATAAVQDLERAIRDEDTQEA